MRPAWATDLGFRLATKAKKLTTKQHTEDNVCTEPNLVLHRTETSNNCKKCAKKQMEGTLFSGVFCRGGGLGTHRNPKHQHCMAPLAHEKSVKRIDLCCQHLQTNICSDTTVSRTSTYENKPLAHINLLCSLVKQVEKKDTLGNQQNLAMTLRPFPSRRN